MPDDVVRICGDDILNHASTFDMYGNSYIWCYGTPTKLWWYRAPQGSAVTCLACLGCGPRGEWEPHPLGRIRFEMREGHQIGIVDTETKS